MTGSTRVHVRATTTDRPCCRRGKASTTARTTTVTMCGWAANPPVLRVATSTSRDSADRATDLGPQDRGRRRPRLYAARSVIPKGAIHLGPVATRCCGQREFLHGPAKRHRVAISAPERAFLAATEPHPRPQHVGVTGAKWIPPWEESVHVQDDLPPLVKIGLLHAQFETIHPFIDGNGGVGRLSITFLLTEWGVLQQPLLYLSGFLRRHIDEHDRRLQLIRDDGDWDGWSSSSTVSPTSPLRQRPPCGPSSTCASAVVSGSLTSANAPATPTDAADRVRHSRMRDFPGCLCSGPEGFRSASANRSGRTAAPAAAWREDGCRAPRSRTHPLSRHRPVPSAGTRVPPTPATGARSRPR